MTLPAALRESVAAAAVAEGLVDAVYSVLPSPLGALLLVAGPRGLARVAYDDRPREAVLAEVAARLGPRVVASAHEMADVRARLAAYLEGEPGARLDDLPVDLALVASPFRRAVLETLRAQVAPGATIAYGGLAARAGRPGAARAVGTAMAANPLPIVVPCHRVLPGSGALGAYTGGVERKRRLLALEGVTPRGR